MTDTTYPIERSGKQSGERGSALVAVLLLLMMMTALAGALSVGAQTETYISRNENSGAMAQAAAEAGLNHAVEIAVTYIFEWKSNGFGSAAEAVNSLLWGPDGDPLTEEDNTSFGARMGIDAAEDIPLEVTPGDRLPIANAVGVNYTAIVMDDDDTAPAAGAFVENGDPAVDLNQRLVIRATGYGPDGSKVILEATIGPVPMPAVVTEGDLTIDGSVEIIGPADPDDGGAVHTNSDLYITGNGGDITGAVTASGEVENSNAGITATGSQPQVDIPPVSAADYEVWATHKLLSDGTMLNVATGLVSNCSVNPNPCNNWEWDGSGTWSLANNDSATGTYYVEGHADISSNQTMTLSVVAEGDITVSGNPELTPHTTELLFVTDMDLQLLGTLATNLAVQGQMLVHEQLEVGGNVTLGGQIVVEDAASLSNTVTSNSIHGNVTINYSGGLGGGTYTVMGWRDVRE